MIRGKIWFRCAVVHDPVCPKVVSPALIGWEAKNRKVDLVIERSFKGDELVARMKGWITVEPSKVIEIVNKYGRLKVLDDTELFVETDTMDDFHSLEVDLKNNFGDETCLDLVKKS
ncbi:MAG: hypothetical protein A2Z02_00350 [Chloroflexi bacterium RBG_16_48_7]|nr:MAG: hypothetical protein A2Z02_00350 [Chloroflexi bacterium RBG_16_48_7]